MIKAILFVMWIESLYILVNCDIPNNLMGSAFCSSIAIVLGLYLGMAEREENAKIIWE